jgi:diguanylate cyclase (GGDEF)-like protein
MARLAEAVARADGVLHELQRTNQKLMHLATTDPLTGVANRRHFLERAEAEVVRARRGGAPFSLLALDLDNFKEVNDSYGHHTGDEVLQRFVEKCIEAIRPYDGIARTGGEEFMVLLPQSVLESACKIGERVRIAIASCGFEAGLGKLVKITVSIGVSQFGRDGDTMDAVLRVADERLYRAKSLGRNRVVAA